MKLIKCKNECDVCDHYKVSTQEKINPTGPHIESNLIYICDKCKVKFADRTRWAEWLTAIKKLDEAISKELS
jgi:hypothetical protein